MDNNKPKIVSDEYMIGRISRQLEIELPNEETIFVNKWAEWNGEVMGDNSGYEFDSTTDQEIFDALDVETQTEIEDIIHEYKLKI